MIDENQEHSIGGLKLMRQWLCLILLIAALSSVDAADWGQWRGPNGTGISEEAGWLTDWPADGPEQLWRTSVGKGYSSVAVSQGRLYTMGNSDDQDTVFCLNAENGEPIWQYSYECNAGDYPGPRSTPAVDGDRVYTLSRRGHLFCFDAATGDIRWSHQMVDEFGAKPPGWEFACSPYILNDWLIVDVGTVHALDKNTGDPVWHSKKYTAGYSTPTYFELKGNDVLAVFNEFGLVIMDASDGSELSSYRWETAYGVNAVTPIVSDGRVFISSGYNVGAALVDVRNSADEVWKNKSMRNHFNNCVLWEGYLYGFDEKTVRCLEFATGKEMWAQEGLGKGSLMLADEKLIVLGEKGDLVIANASPAKFDEIGRTKVLDKTCWTVPVLANGRIYCRNDQGNLVCVDVSGE